MQEHRFLCARVVVPFIQRGHVDGESFHCLERMRLAFLEAAALFFSAHREPELEQMHARAHQLPFEFGCLAQEFVDLVVRAKPITRSTPARLYQLRSKSTISPAWQVAQCGAGNTIGHARFRSAFPAQPRAPRGFRCS